MKPQHLPFVFERTVGKFLIGGSQVLHVGGRPLTRIQPVAGQFEAHVLSLAATNNGLQAGAEIVRQERITSKRQSKRICVHGTL